ncbi:MAG: RNA 2',3'-cyclic phosphodiesterase [archaeon]
MGELKRCFIALDLPRNAINEIKRIQKLIKEKVIFTGKLTEVENLHLTLKFLGEIDEGKIKEIKDKLSKIKINQEEVRDFFAELGKIGMFSKKMPKIVWIKLNGKIVFELQEKIDDVLRGLFEPEHRFMSHITIARVRYVEDKKGFNEYLESIKPKKIRFKVEDFILKKSELFSEGPVYEDIMKYKL